MSSFFQAYCRRRDLQWMAVVTAVAFVCGWSMPVRAADAPKADGAAAEAKEPAAKAERPAAAIHYKQILTDEEYKKNAETYRKERTTIARILGAQAFSGQEDEEKFDGYYKNYALARWTIPSEYTSLQKHRAELRNDLFKGKSGPPYDRLLKMAFNGMKRLSSSPEYHPAVRFNAMLALGELNVQENPPGSIARVVPLPEARRELLAALKDSDSDAVKVAALVGLSRHAGIAAADPQARAALAGEAVPLLLDLAKSSPPAGRSPEGHAWMRAMAIDVLAALKLSGADGSIVTALAEIAGDKNAPMLTRMAAARAIGALDFQGVGQLAPSKIAAPLGQLAVDACSVELDRHRAEGTSAPKGMGGSRGMMTGGMMPGGMMAGGMMPGGMMSGASGSMPGKMPGSMPGGMSGSMPGGMMSGMPGGSGGATAGKKRGTARAEGPGETKDDVNAKQVVLFRRSLKQCLNAVRLGLNGPEDPKRGAVRGLAGEGNPDHNFVDGIFDIVQEEIKNLDDKDATYDKLSTETLATQKELRAFLEGGPAAAATSPRTKPSRTPGKK